MFTDFVSMTELQRSLKKLLSAKPFQMILCNNKLSGMLLSRKVSELLINSGILEQIQEELYELNDKETVKVIQEYRSGKKKTISLEEFKKKYAL